MAPNKQAQSTNATKDARESATTTSQSKPNGSVPTPVPAAKVAKAPQTPEQEQAAKARKMRDQARALRTSAIALGDPEGKGEAKSLIVRAANLDKDADAIAPLKSAKSKEARPTCTSLKKDGSACTAKAMQGKTVCTDHRPAREHLNKEQLDWFAAFATDTNAVLEEIGWGRVKRLYELATQPQGEVAKGTGEEASA